MLTKFTLLLLLSQAPPLPRVPVPLPLPAPIICPEGEVPIGPICVPMPSNKYV